MVGVGCESATCELALGTVGKSLIKSVEADAAVVGTVCVELFDDDDERFVEGADVDGNMYSKLVWLYGEEEFEADEVNEGDEFELKYLVENCA